MEPETEIGVGRLGALGPMWMRIEDMEKGNGEIGPREMRF